MPCGCKKGHGVSIRGAGVRRKKGGMAISGAGVRLTGAGYKKRRKGRRKRAKRARGARGGGLITASLFNPVAALASLIRRRKMGRKGSGGRFLSGAVWHGYGKGSGMSVPGAGLYGKRLLGRGGSGRRQI